MTALLIAAALAFLLACGVVRFGVDSRDGKDWQRLPRP
jgi:uncharacterized membrane protein SpoIIM required for sporulation